MNSLRKQFIVAKLINECDIQINDIDGFILVGGSTRLKIIKKLLINLKNQFLMI